MDRSKIYLEIYCPHCGEEEHIEAQVYLFRGKPLVGLDDFALPDHECPHCNKYYWIPDLAGSAIALDEERSA